MQIKIKKNGNAAKRELTAQSSRTFPQLPLTDGHKKAQEKKTTFTCVTHKCVLACYYKIICVCRPRKPQSDSGTVEMQAL